VRERGTCNSRVSRSLVDLDETHPDVDDILWIRNRGTKYCVKYLVEILWPALIDEFVGPKMTRKQLKDHLGHYRYVKEQTGRIT